MAGSRFEQVARERCAPSLVRARARREGDATNAARRRRMRTGRDERGLAATNRRDALRLAASAPQPRRAAAISHSIRRQRR
jgi:hypothetical protein